MVTRELYRKFLDEPKPTTREEFRKLMDKWQDKGVNTEGLRMIAIQNGWGLEDEES